MNPGAHIVASDVTLRYATRDVLTGVDLSVAPGELVALLGPSGCGKSSLLRAVAGLTRTTSGTIRVDGETVVGPRPEVALAFQDPGLLPWLTVERNVGFGLTFARQPTVSRALRKERVTRALAAVGLEHARHWDWAARASSPPVCPKPGAVQAARSRTRSTPSQRSPSAL